MSAASTPGRQRVVQALGPIGVAVALHRLVGAVVAKRAVSGATRTWTINLSALVLILALGTVLTYVTPIDAGAIWLFFGVSLLVVAIRGDAGCEALAISNALQGRRERTSCVAFAAVDSLEARRGR